MLKYAALCVALAIIGAVTLPASGRQLAPPPSQLTIAPPMLLGVVGEVALSRTHIAFSYAGDLWSVGRDGGQAARLTDGPAEDVFPIFSPDGQWLAFAKGAADVDVYVMPASGGAPRRLTYFPKPDVPVGWSADGRTILISSSARDGDGHTRLYTIPAAGGLETALPLPAGVQGSFAPDGKRLAYLPKSVPINTFGTWRHYRGGMASPLWIVELDGLQIERVTTDSSNVRFPTWVGTHIYFVSDRNGTFNLYDYDTTTKRMRALTDFQSFGIDGAAATDEAIAFVRHGRIYLYDVKTGAQREVTFSLSIDAPERAPRTVAATRWLESVDYAASSQMLVAARGDILLLNPETGDARALTTTSAVAERYPAMSPDQQRLAFFSDESGEYELHIRTLSTGAIKKINIEDRPSFYREPTWSPDSRKLAFSDIRLALWVADVEAGAVRRLDTSRYVAQGEYRPDWSPDGRYLTYSKAGPTGVRAAFVCDLSQTMSRQITDGLTHVESPVFDRSGKYLYFISSSNARLAAASDTGWGLLSTELARPLVRRSLHLMVLRAGERAPWLPTVNRLPPGPAPAPSSSDMRIDFEHLDRRIVQVPVGIRDYTALVAGPAGRLYVRVAEWPPTPGAGVPTSPLYRFDVASPTRLDKMADNVNAWFVSRDRTRISYATSAADLYVIGGAEKPVRLDLQRLQIQVTPFDEWRQMYREAWRQMRDTFYDANHHGQNLAELERQYATLLPSITRRIYLNRLFSRMLGHVSVSHLGVGGGDVPGGGGGGAPVGDIGADFTLDSGRYRFAHIVRSPHFSAASGLLNAPLDQPGVDVREGDYLIAVDGQPADVSTNAHAFFDGKVNQPIQLTVSSTPTGDSPRVYTVVPHAGTGDLRNQDRGETNRRRVETLSGGKLAYVYIGGYDARGIDDVTRGLIGMSDKQGLIIDQRYNGGGITSDSLIEALNRQQIYEYAYRYGDGFPTPPVTFDGPKVLMTNEQNFSAAETFALMFKLTKTGTIVGQRTGGGGIGSALFQPLLIDRGRIAIPNRAAYNPAGSWDIENRGVLPDVSVEVLPRDWREGRDPQLEKAVQVALDAIVKQKSLPNRRPQYPVHK